MNNQQKLKLFRKIITHLNKKFCKNKIIVNEITLFKEGDLHKSFPNKKGWYFNIKKKILIREDESFVMQVIILVHEFTHAYQHQILMCKSRLKHDKTSGKIYQKFLKETDKVIKISKI